MPILCHVDRGELHAFNEVLLSNLQRLTGVQAVGFIRGRDFTAADGADSPPVVIVNRTLAEHYWPGQDLVGKACTSVCRKAQLPGRFHLY
jgi:hypothetical protein